MGAAHGNTIADRINTRIEYDRKNDFRISAEEFLCGQRVWLPGKRALNIKNLRDRQEIDRITQAIRVFIAPISVNIDDIKSWLAGKEVSNPRRYYVVCIENEIMHTITAASPRCAEFLWNEPKEYKPIAFNVITDGFDIIGLTTAG